MSLAKDGQRQAHMDVLVAFPGKDNWSSAGDSGEGFQMDTNRHIFYNKAV